MICKWCQSPNTIRRGNKNRKNRQVTQYQCKECKRYTPSVPHSFVSAKILLLDIETSPMEYYSWSRDPQYLSPEMLIKDWGILCWSAKWLFEKEIMGQVVKTKEAINRTEESILGEIWSLMDRADIIITQNGIKFDIRKLYSKFIRNGYPPPSHFLNIDTLMVARSKFGETYNSLEELGNGLLGLEDGKIKMNIADWKKCVTGSQEYLDKMLLYCKNDVAPLLEDVYLAMRPWISNHPNLNLFSDHEGDVCPNCESQNLKWHELYTTPQGVWIGFRCQACGALGRGTKKEHSIRKVSIKST